MYYQCKFAAQSYAIFWLNWQVNKYIWLVLTCTDLSREKKNAQFYNFCRSLREVTLEESIRYRPNDEVEKWLNQLLCLDANIVPFISSGTPSPEDCNLYYVNRDTLFCYHRASENFLQRIMALFVASHYKNTPDDLQLLRLASQLTPFWPPPQFRNLEMFYVWFGICKYF